MRAALITPIVIEGRVIERSQGPMLIPPPSSGGLNIYSYPTAGMSCHLTANSQIRLYPSQNDGRARPSTAKIIATRSIQVFAFHAARIPRGMPMTIARNSEKMARERVGSSRENISSLTSWRVKTDWPRSPRIVSRKKAIP